jgi:hypothetical protein
MQQQRQQTNQENNGENSREQTKKAFHEAEKDIERDPDLRGSSPNDDLDEGETARLGEGKNDLI